MKNINWRPKLKIHQTIKLTYDWYANFFKNKKMIYKFTEKQIIRKEKKDKLYFKI